MFHRLSCRTQNCLVSFLLDFWGGVIILHLPSWQTGWLGDWLAGPTCWVTRPRWFLVLNPAACVFCLFVSQRLQSVARKPRSEVWDCLGEATLGGERRLRTRGRRGRRRKHFELEEHLVLRGIYCMYANSLTLISLIQCSIQSSLWCELMVLRLLLLLLCRYHAFTCSWALSQLRISEVRNLSSRT